jgi:hypothetical protein
LTRRPARTPGRKKFASSRDRVGSCYRLAYYKGANRGLPRAKALQAPRASRERTGRKRVQRHIAHCGNTGGRRVAEDVAQRPSFRGAALETDFQRARNHHSQASPRWPRQLPAAGAPRPQAAARPYLAVDRDNALASVLREVESRDDLTCLGDLLCARREGAVADFDLPWMYDGLAAEARIPRFDAFARKSGGTTRVNPAGGVSRLASENFRNRGGAGATGRL